MRSVINRIVALLFVGMIIQPAIGADNIVSQALTGPAPSIDGTKAVGEWTGSPNLQLTTPTYPIQTDVYFRHDSQNLYVLVDAIGDVNDTNYDECLLVFGLPPNLKIAEMWKDNVGVVTANAGTVATAYGMGMTADATPHRFYEFQIPFSNLGVQPGQSIPFSSPRVIKMPGWYGDFASMPLDASDRRDNEYPNDLHVTTDNGSPPVILTMSNYSMLQFGAPAVIPTLSEWGLALSAALLAAYAGWYAWRRRQT